jgi:hypothetical protein
MGDNASHMGVAGSTGGSRGVGAISRLLLHLGMLAAALSFTSWWVSHTILDVSRTQRVTHAVLADSDFRAFVAGEISPMIQEEVPGVVVPTAALQSRVATVLDDPGVRSQLETFVVDIHKGLLGERDQPAVLDQPTLARIVTAAVPSIPPEDLAQLHAVSINPPRLGPLSTTRKLLQDKFGLLVAVAALLLVGGVALSGNRRQALSLIGRWLIVISLVHLVFLWAIPVLILPAVTSSPWASLIAAVAKALSAGLLTGLVILFVAGVGLLVINRFVGNPNRTG